MLEPSFLLLDEPFSGIDPIQVLELQRIIWDLKKSGIGILVTDHSVRETLAVTNRAYIISNGRIFRSGSPKDLANDPEVKAFIWVRTSLCLGDWKTARQAPRMAPGRIAATRAYLDHCS